VAGLPNQVPGLAMSRTTTDPAPTTTSSQIFTPYRMMLLLPMKTRSPTWHTPFMTALVAM
jgi:hypothetical protein